MELALMRYKGFTLRYNPTSVEILSRRNTVGYLLPEAGESFADIGERCTVIKGECELRGDDCLEQYASLRSLQKSGDAGVLSIPGQKPVYAFFTELKALADVTPDRIRCSFEFTEESTHDKSDVHSCTHKVAQGETLYDIAYRFNVTVDSLVELNPQVCRPDELAEGEEIRIC